MLQDDEENTARAWTAETTWHAWVGVAHMMGKQFHVTHAYITIAQIIICSSADQLKGAHLRVASRRFHVLPLQPLLLVAVMVWCQVLNHEYQMIYYSGSTGTTTSIPTGTSGSWLDPKQGD